MYSRFLTFVLFACFASPTGYAIGIGELTMRSGLGELLHAQVNLQLGQGEVIDISCLSLSEEKDSGSFLPTGWIVSLDESGHKVEIRSLKPFNELFAIFSLKIKCSDQSSISRTFTLLPEFKPNPPPQSAEIATPVNVNQPSSHVIQDETARIAGQSARSDTPPALPLRGAPVAGTGATQHRAGQKAKSRQGKTTNRPAGSRSEKHSALFRLKLSGEPLDLSQIGKIDPQKLEWILARQKLMDEDDQAAQYLSVLNKMKLMQEELGVLKLRLAELEGGAAQVAARQAVMSPAKPVPENSSAWGAGLMLLGWLAAILLVSLVVRHVGRSQSRTLQLDRSTEEGIAIQPERRILKSAAELTPIIKREKNAQTDSVVGAPRAQQNTPAATERSFAKEENEVLGEAELYAVHGHPDKGVKILHEFVLRYPGSEKAWMLLLSICSSRGQVKAFEGAARSFLSQNKNNHLWASIQVLGRTLDQENPLYNKENNQGASESLLPHFAHHKRRLIGDILVELNYISAQDMENCLKDFDPRRHGRLGNYLVMRKQVSYAQLGKALMEQQASDGTLQHHAMPTLQQMEDLLKDFDPQRDGSVEEFLLSHQASIAEHLMYPIQSTQQETQAQQKEQSVNTREQGEYCSVDFVLDFDQDASSGNMKLAHSAEDKSQPLEFDLELSNHLARNNPRGI